MTNELIRAADLGVPLRPGANGGIDPSPALRERMVAGPPFVQQHLLEYVFARIPNLDKTWLAFAAESLRSDAVETEWVAAYYRPALAALPPKFVHAESNAIEEQVGFMDADQERSVEQWSATGRNG